MKNVIARWALLLTALLVVGPLLARMHGLLQAGDGGPDVTALTSAGLVVGLGVLIAQFVVATLMGALTANLVGYRSGLVAAGFALLAPAHANGTLLGLVRWDSAGGMLQRLAMEGALVGVLGTLSAIAIVRAARRHQEEQTDKVASASSGIALLVALAGAAAVSWIVARETLAGQTIGAAALGALAGATLGRIAAPRAPVAVFVVAIGLLAAAGPIVGMMVHGSGIMREVYELHIVPLARPLPLHWMAGGLIGVPLGTAWAAQMLEKKVAKTAAAR